MNGLEPPLASNDSNGSLCILGLGREGRSTYTYLRKKFPNRHIFLFDEKPLDALTTWKEISQNDVALVSFHTTVPLQQLTDPVIFCSPGIPPTRPLYQALAALAPTWSSNLEEFFSALPDNVVTIGITGTKGKSTTSAVINHLLKTAKLSTILAGNGGTPALDVLESINTLCDSSEKVYAVLELSSHQLSRLSRSPHIAVIQNITPEHLDYYGTFAEYVAAKTQIVKNQTDSDLVLFCADYPESTKLAFTSAGKKMSFSLEGNAATIKVNTENENLVIDGEMIVNLAKLPLLGKHNLINCIPGILIAKHLDITTETITQGLTTFVPLQHRLEIVHTTDDITYINDSLATTPEATLAALDAVGDKPCILIAGGHDRHLDYHELAQAILNHKVKAVLLFPPTGETIIRHMYQLEPTNMVVMSNYFKVASMWEAVKKAKSLAKPGDVVLLSPAAASFGIFKDYEDRGEQFKQAVAELSVTQSE